MDISGLYSASSANREVLEYREGAVSAGQGRERRNGTELCLDVCVCNGGGVGL